MSMQTFAQKQNLPQKPVSSSLVRFNTAIPGPNHREHPILHLQRAIGNQAVQQMLQTNAEECEAELIGTASPWFGHDFSHIPILLPAAGTIQTKLAVNKSGDENEQEADRISEQVMRMPEQIQRACTCGGTCPKCQTEQPGHRHGRLQTQRVGSGVWGPTEVPPIVHEVLRSPGQPIDLATRAFMEPRFGHDFSQVRVHHGGKAAESAKSINALAYTSGNHIAFNDGQYSPTTERGKRLLAHELVHTMQQANNVLHRKIEFTEPQPIFSDPIPLVLGGRSILGRTLPGFSGTLLPESAIKKDYKEAIFKTLQPQAFDFAHTQKKGMTCKVAAEKFNIDVFAEVRAITEPRNNKWSGSYPLSILSNPPSVCAEKRKNDAIQVEMEGKPDSTALYKKVLSHEQEHVTDLKNLSTGELKSYHDFLIKLTGAGNTDRDCVDDIFKQVGNRDALAASNFVDKWLIAVTVYDKPGGTHHSKFETKVDANCTKMQISEKL
jgi:hypothetical protein